MWLFSPLLWNEKLRKARERKDLVGFSLAELIVVVAIVALLAAIATPIFLNQKKKAYKATVVSDGTSWSADIASMAAKYATFGDEPPAGTTVPNYAGGNITLDPVTKDLVLTMPNESGDYSYKPASLDTSQTMTATTSPGSTIRAFTAGDYRNGYVAQGRAKQWCFIAENNTQVAVFTNNGYVASASECPQPTAEKTSLDAPTVALATNPYYKSLLATITPPTVIGYSPIIDYTVEYQANGETNWTAITGVTTTTNYIIQNLAYGGTYNVKVRARNSEGMSPYSNIAQATVATRIPDSPTMGNTRNWGTTAAPANPGGDITQPDCTNVYFNLDTYVNNFTGPASDSINVQTTPGPFDGGMTVDRYELQWRLDTGQAATTGTWTSTVASASPNIQVTGIPADTNKYQYQIRAHNNVGLGWSSYTSGVFTRGIANSVLTIPSLNMSVDPKSVRANSIDAPDNDNIANGVYATDDDKKSHIITVMTGNYPNTGPTNCGWVVDTLEIVTTMDQGLPSQVVDSPVATITGLAGTSNLQNITRTFTGDGDRTYAFKIRAIGTNGGAPVTSAWSPLTQNYLTVPNQPETHFLWWWNKPDWSAVPSSTLLGYKYPANVNNVVEPHFSMNYGSSLYRRGDSQFLFDFNSSSPAAATESLYNSATTDYGQLKVLTGNYITSNQTNAAIVTNYDARGKMKADWTRFDSSTNVCNLSFFGNPFQAMCQKFQLTGTTNYYMAVRARNNTGEAWASNQKSGPDNNNMVLAPSVLVSSNTTRQSIRSNPQDLAMPMMSPESFADRAYYDIWNFENYHCANTETTDSQSCIRNSTTWVNTYDLSQNKYLTGYSTAPTSNTLTTINGAQYWTRDLRTNNPVEGAVTTGAGTRERYRIRANGWDQNSSDYASTWNITPQTFSWDQSYTASVAYTATGDRIDHTCRAADPNAPNGAYPLDCVQRTLKWPQGNPQISGGIGFQRRGWRFSTPWVLGDLGNYNIRACNYEITNTIIQCTTSPTTYPTRSTPGSFTYAGQSTYSMTVKRINTNSDPLSWYVRPLGFLPLPDTATATRLGKTCSEAPVPPNQYYCGRIGTTAPNGSLGFGMFYTWYKLQNSVLVTNGGGSFFANGDHRYSCSAVPAGWSASNICPGSWVTLINGFPQYEYTGVPDNGIIDSPGGPPLYTSQFAISLAYAGLWNHLRSYPAHYIPFGAVSCWRGRGYNQTTAVYQGSNITGTGGCG